jgi:hypothetical protein
MRAQHPRSIGLFLAVSLVLISVAVLSARLRNAGETPPPPAAWSFVAPSTPSIARLDAVGREEARLRDAGRRFISAFLRYEVGDMSPRVRSSLLASGTSAFARELEGAPVRGIGHHSAARIDRLDVTFLNTSAQRALLSGVARRPDGPEEFSFLFGRRDGRWLVLGAAE